MMPVERLKRAGELLDQAVAEVEDAEESVEAWCKDSLRFLRVELKVSSRRIGNVRKVLGGEP